jgi:hypothetical protein
MEPSRNFDLRLSGSLAVIEVEVVDSPAGQTTAPSILPCAISSETLTSLEAGDLTPGRHLGDALGERSLQPPDLPAIGRALWRCAFGAPAVAELWRASRGSVGPEGVLRLRLLIDSAELAALPWELLYDETLGRFLALDGQTPVTRFTRLPIPTSPWPQDRPLRLLFTGASPADMPTLAVAKEWTGIEQVLAPLLKEGRLETPQPIPQGATLPALLAALRRQVDIWHFAGHGADNGLAFADVRGRSNQGDAGMLGQMLAGEGVRLAVLNACRAGAGGGQAASVAGALLWAGVPAVVAMQATVSDTAADAFAGAFYDAIAVGQGVDQAVTAARKAMWATGTAEWWVPALFMRTPDGTLWKKATPHNEGDAPSTHKFPLPQRLVLICAIAMIIGGAILLAGQLLSGPGGEPPPASVASPVSEDVSVSQSQQQTSTVGEDEDGPSSMPADSTAALESPDTWKPSIAKGRTEKQELDGEWIAIYVVQPASPVYQGSAFVDRVDVLIETPYDRDDPTLTQRGCVFVRPFIVTFLGSELRFVGFPDMVREFYDFLVVKRSADFNVDSCTNLDE